MTPETFPQQTISYLMRFPADTLAAVCERLTLSEDGTKDSLFRRIYREVGFREGWLPRLSEKPTVFSRSVVLPFVKWYPLLRRGASERDLYSPFLDEMCDVFGEDNVHEQLPVAHGSSLRIDFHIGHPREGGVGVEFKMPTNNTELQRALGQIDQYTARYGPDLIVVLVPDFLQPAQRVLFLDDLRRKEIETVVKELE